MNSISFEKDLIQKLDSVKTIGASLRWVQETSSTNDYLRTLAKSEPPEGLVVLADTQTSGKGRQGRTWLSPPGKGLYFSVLLKPRLPIENLHQITLVAAVGLITALKPWASSASLKWPNDVLMGRKKLAGILSETVPLKNEIGIILGIGVNVNHRIEDFPPPLNQTATSLLLETGREENRVELAAQFLAGLDESYDLFKNSGLAPIIAAWEQNSSMLGQDISVLKGKETIKGKALRLAPTGGLVISTSENQEMVLESGEVHLSHQPHL